MSKIKISIACGVAALALASGAAQATVTLVGSQATFSADGMISQDTNWDSYGAGFFTEGSPFSVGSLTFVAGAQNLIGGVGTTYNLSRNLFTDNLIRGTTIDVAGRYNLFAVNAGNFFAANSETFDVTTNLGSYVFNMNIGSAANHGALDFVGFEAGPGEYIDSVQFTGSGATGVTDVQLGVSAVPEPTSIAMMMLGVVGLGAAARARKKNDAHSA